MNAVAAQRFGRPVHLTAALLLGVPSALIGGYFTVWGLVVGTMHAMQRWPTVTGLDMLLLVWLLAGVLGVTAWLRLTLAYVTGGTAGLRGCHAAWWTGLLAGIMAASPLLHAVLTSLAEGRFNVPLLLGGPLLIPLSLHLAWLCFRRSRLATATAD